MQRWCTLLETVFSICVSCMFSLSANNFAVGFRWQKNNGQVWFLRISLWVFVDRKKIARSDGLEFPWWKPTDGKFQKSLGIKKTTGKLLFPYRFIPGGAHTGKLFFYFLSVFCNFLWVCSLSEKFQFPVVLYLWNCKVMFPISQKIMICIFKV